MLTSVGIFLDTSILDKREYLKNFLRKVGYPTKHNLLFLIIPEKDLIALEGMPKGQERLNYIDGVSVLYSLWTDIDIDMKEVSLGHCKPEYVLQFIDAMTLSFEEDFIIVSELKENLIQLGFSSPTQCKKDKICVMKKNNNSKADAEETYRDIEFLKSQKSTDRCSIKLQLNKKSVDFLKHIVRAGVKEKKDGRHQREIFGSLSIVGNSKDKSIVHTLGVHMPSLQFGEKEQVDSAVPSLYTFHSHPYQAYIRNKTTMGFPSVSDFIATYLMYEMGMIVHFVATMEGLYIVNVDIDSKHLQKSNRDIKKFITKSYKVDRKTIKNLHHYLKNINEIGLFNVRLVSWESAGNPFDIQFKKSDNKCIIRDIS